ncbi:hypothetical protein PRZ48_013734 [Zasmidium cellare]|uniref:Altered inheritance of mitochondria protein 11 n=1 Tax=Zasmidium cellare TaxID=395010 RepID=A0ABR0E2N7_ZASCE|nr:hypothetical protein PRZ48_013734 [Zasmidium cellare]
MSSAWMSSWWDKYFAPGDVRAARRQEEQQVQQKAEALEKRPAPIIPNRIDAAHRARRQNALLFGGLAFTFLSAFVTRRALTKKQHITALYPHLTKTPKGADPRLEVPHFTTSNNQAKAEGGLDAVEALFLATINVGAIFMLGTGAVMKALDIADIEDVRELVKKGTGQDIYGGEAEADKEMEEWVAGVLAKKDEKGAWDFQSTIAEKLKELDDIEKRKAQKLVEQDVEKR